MNYKEAQRKVKALKGFYIHLGIYVAVMAVLLLINFLTGDGWWANWPLFGWGIAVAINAVVLFFDIGLFDSKWEQRKKEQFMMKGM